MIKKHKSEDYKLSAVKYFLESKLPQTKVCKIFKCSERSLMRWVNKYLYKGSIKRNSRPSISYKLNKNHVKFILEIVKNNKSITMKDLYSELLKEYPNLKISERHISNILDDNYITLKLRRLRHTPIKRFGKDVNIKEQLKDFYNKIKRYNLDDIICIDETSFESYHTRQYCYSEEGKRCIIKTNNQEVFKKYTGIFAITTKGCIGHTIYLKGGIDTNRLTDFLNEFILSKFKNKLIIMDNASSHRNENIKRIVNENNNLLYSIPYQHYTNCIENFFSIMKNRLYKIKGIGYNQLNRNIDNIIKEIPLSIYKNNTLFIKCII
jgi:transposase